MPKSIFFLYVLIIFNVPLTFKLKLPNVYYFYTIALYIILIVKSSPYRGLTKRRILPFYIYFFVFIVLFIIELIFGFISNINASFISLTNLFWIPFFFILLYKTSADFNFKILIKQQVYIAIIIAGIGFVQFFFSRDLFGFIPRGGVYKEMYDNWNLPFRANSILYSGQVYGLFCVLYLILLLEYRKLFRKAVFIISVFVLFLGGLLSGNKSITVILILYFIIKTLVYGKKNLSQSLIYSIILLIAIGSFIDTNKIVSETFERAFSWTIDFDSNSLTTSDSQRLYYYKKTLHETNFVVGAGVGRTISRDNKSNYVNPESYLLKLYVEGGSIIVLFYLVFLLSSLIYYFNSHQRSLFLIFSSIIISMFFVHAFSSPVFFGMWGIIFYGLVKGGTQELIGE